MSTPCPIPLGDLGEITVGHQLRKAVMPDPKGDHCLIQLRNAQDGVLDLSDASRMTLDPKSVRHLARCGDILLRSRGATYGAALVDCVPENSVPIAPLFLLRLFRSAPVSQDYLVWFINREATQAVLKSSERGTYTPSVSVESFKTLPIVVPSLEKQAKIVEVDALTRREREITQKLQAARAKQAAAILEQTLVGAR